MAARASVLMATLALWPAQCSDKMAADANSRAAPTAPLAAARGGAGEGPTRMEALPGAEPPVFVMRGHHDADVPIVFLHGMCGHGLGYAQSFQFAAAKKGVLIAPQGDKPCGGPWASWTVELAAIDARIVAAFRSLGVSEPVRDVTLIGYSQGASRAEALARQWPERYSRLVLIGQPEAPSPRGLGHVRSAVMMAGERDRLDLMKSGAAAFRTAGIPAEFQAIPEARHGEMGPHPERTMGAALDWLWQHDRQGAARAAAP